MRGWWIPVTLAGALALAGCSDAPKESKGDKGDPGPPGPKGDPGVAGGGEHLGRRRAPLQGADERVLAAAGADYEDASSAQRAEMKSSTGIAERVS